MPELPEVEALKDFLTENLVGHEIVRVLPVAISVLKTYDPPVTSVEGHEVTAVRRYGKFLDLTTASVRVVRRASYSRAVSCGVSAAASLNGDILATCRISSL